MGARASLEEETETKIFFNETTNHGRLNAESFNCDDGIFSPINTEKESFFSDPKDADEIILRNNNQHISDLNMSPLSVSLSVSNSSAGNGTTGVELFEENRNEAVLRYLTTNARSLSPKIMSLIELFEECHLHFSIVTESWLTDGRQLDQDIVDLEHGTDLKIIYKNRPMRRNSRRKVGGGIAIVYNKSMCNFKEVRQNRAGFELVCAQGRVDGINRHILIIGGYIEPRSRVAQVDEMKTEITDIILKVKAQKKDPLVVIGGDWNKRDIAQLLQTW